MKFGGTSVGIPANFSAAVSLVVERLPVQPLVVVSALHGVTNLLVDYARDPLARPRHSAEFVDRHLRFLLEVGLDPDLLARRLAEWNGEPAGFAVWFVNFSTFAGRHGIYLEDLFVRPALRGKGIGFVHEGHRMGCVRRRPDLQCGGVRQVATGRRLVEGNPARRPRGRLERDQRRART